jgi:hypothetical protein
MQSVGLQTVLQMSNVGERVAQNALTHGAVASEQFKDIIEKQVEAKKIEVQESQQVDTVQLHPDDERGRQKRQQDEREHQAQDMAKMKEEHADIAAPARPMPADASPQGRLLNIKV